MPEDAGDSPVSERNALLLVFLVFCVVGLVIYGPALDGAFISDDNHYVAENEYVHTPSLENLAAIWSPRSEVTVLVENYAPVHLMLHVLTWQLFGSDVRGHHVVNVMLHALAAVLLVPIYRRSGIARWAAIAGAALFLLHPANVESVAWISQLKSASALILSLLAILLHPRRPLAALAAFALALFAKPFSAFALVVVALFGLSGRGAEGERSAWRWPWLLGWLAVVGGFAIAEIAAFSQSAGLAPPLYADLAVRYRTIFAVALRYLAMAASGRGLSAFHEPPPAESFLDPLFLGGALALALLGWRTWVAWRRRSDEAVYWVWAAVSFAPLSGVLPLPYPMADRYLYFVLPGLIGGVLLAGRDLWSAVAGRLGERALVVQRAGMVLAALLALHFAWASHARAPVFQSAESLMADAERNYPDGAAANTRKARRAALRGDRRAAVAYLRAAHARGYNRVDHLLADPAYGAMAGDPDFLALQHAMADDWIERLGADPAPSHYKARALAQAYIVKQDLAAALRVIEAASERPGPIGDDLRADAEELRREIARRRRLEAERARR